MSLHLHTPIQKLLLAPGELTRLIEKSRKKMHPHADDYLYCASCNRILTEETIAFVHYEVYCLACLSIGWPEFWQQVTQNPEEFFHPYHYKVSDDEIDWTYVYLIASDVGRYKIGLTGNLNQRLKQLRRGNPLIIHVDCLIPFESRKFAARMEQELHERFADKRIQSKEWFDLSASDVEFIRGISRCYWEMYND